MATSVRAATPPATSQRVRWDPSWCRAGARSGHGWRPASRRWAEATGPSHPPTRTGPPASGPARAARRRPRQPAPPAASRERRRRSAESLRHDGLRRRSRERRLAGKHLVQHASQAVDVASGVHSRSPAACSGLMYAGVPTVSPVSVSCSRSAASSARAMPKSATSACPSGEEDVLGLDVAVDDAVLVGVVERRRRLRARSRPRPRPGAARRASSRSRRLSPSTYGMVNQSWPRRLARVEHGEDVRVLQPGGDSGSRAGSDRGRAWR